MSEAVAKRYAEALFDVASEHGKIEAFEEQLQSVTQVIAESDELRKVLTHPQITKQNKKQLLEQTFSSSVDQSIMNLLKLLVDRNRAGIISDLFHEFISYSNEARGIVDMTVTTASPLTDEEKGYLSESFSKKTNKTLRINTKVNSDIIGGMIVKIGNRVFDSSLKGKLARFKQELKVGR